MGYEERFALRVVGINPSTWTDGGVQKYALSAVAIIETGGASVTLGVGQ